MNVYWVGGVLLSLALKVKNGSDRGKVEISRNYNGLLSFFVSLTSSYLHIAGVEGWCCIWSHTQASTYTYTHTHTHGRARARVRLVGLPWTRDQFVAETCTCKTHNSDKRQMSMSPEGFEPEIPASKRPQTYAVVRANTGTSTNGLHNCLMHLLVSSFQMKLQTFVPYSKTNTEWGCLRTGRWGEIFETKGEELTESGRELHSEKFRNLYLAKKILLGWWRQGGRNRLARNISWGNG